MKRRAGLMVMLVGLVFCFAVFGLGDLSYARQLTQNNAEDSKTDIARDSSGNPHIVYERGGTIYYLVRSNGTWSTEESVGEGTGPAIAVDSTGVPHVVFISSGGVAKYTKRIGGSWQEPVDVSTDTGVNYIDIDVDGGGNAHVVYSTPQGDGDIYNELFYVNNTFGGTFGIPQIFADGGDDSGSGNYYHHPTIKVTPAGRYITYIQQQNWDGSVPSSSEGITTITTVAGRTTPLDHFVSEVFNTVWFGKNSMAVDSNGDVHLVYAIGGTHYYAKVTATVFTHSQLSGVSQPSVSLKSADEILIAYVNANGGISYIVGNGEDWEDPVLLNSTTSGRNPSVSAGDVTFFAYEASDGDYEVFFNQDRYTITASAIPPEGGSIVCDPLSVDHGETSTCTITPNEGYILLNAGATCGGGISGNIFTTNPVTDNCTVIADFGRDEYTLTVTKTGTGSGTVTSNPAGIDCGSDCEADFEAGSTVTLTATPAQGSVFSGWSGHADCSDGVVTMDANKTCIATFNILLTINKAGNGSGWVMSSPAGIDCGEDCSEPYEGGTTVSLLAIADFGSTFAGWSGDCSGPNPSVEVLMNASKTCTATFTLIPRTLTVEKAGTGSGTVTSDPAGINCGADCSEPYNHGTVVTLTATAGTNSVFRGWSGACSGTAPEVRVTMDANKSCTATFNLQHTLTVTKAGAGLGTVTSSPAGINCPGDCTEPYDQGTVVTLTAAAGDNSLFAGWSGACSGTDPEVQVTMDGAKSCTATFNLVQRTLTVATAGNGTGSVTSSPVGIDCPGDCTEDYNHGTVVTLTPTPGPNSVFAGWSGHADCSDGQVTMDANKSCTATFNLVQRTLTVATAGNGTGSVTSSPVGIDCPGDCTEAYDHGTSVTLTPNAGPNSVFAGWSGHADCSDGQVTMDANKSCTATFNLVQRTLTVAKIGTGSGTVTSNPEGINCGADCTEDYDHGTVVTLTANAASGSVFTGWSGACSGTNPTAQVTMDAAKTCTARFDITLYVTKTGTGSGRVTSTPAGIDCGNDCSEPFSQGQTVTLLAVADFGSTFDGWSGACSGTSPTVQVTMDATKTCTATFTLVQHNLVVTKAGTGTGTVTSSPEGINCGADCSELYDHGTVVTLTAAPGANSVFRGWSVGCSGTDLEVQVTMEGARTCTATFNLQHTLTVTKTGLGSGTVTSNPAGINCGADCTEPYDQGTVVTLTATPGANSVFAGWSGDCDENGQVTINGAKSCTATFNLVQRTLTVNKIGTGSGTVISSPEGINCGADCTENYDHGTVVTLTAVPESGSLFAGWSGACSGTSPTVQVTVDGAKTCTARFDECIEAPSDMVAWWRAEGNPYDSAGIYHGMIINNVTFAPGKVGQAFSFDGTNAYVEIEDSQFGDVGALPFTVEFWIYPLSEGNGSYIMGKSHPDSGQGWDIRLHQGKIRLEGTDGWDPQYNWESNTTLSINTWHHIAISAGTDEISVYINGALDGTTSRGVISSTTNPFRIGYTTHFGGTPFYGLIDEVSIYGRALDIDEIEEIYDAGIAGKCFVADTEPDPFRFTDQSNVDRNTVVTSNTILVSGINSITSISISDCTSTSCEYRINGGDWTSEDGIVLNGDEVTVRQTSSGSYSTTTNLTLNIGGVTDTFSVTTLPIPQRTLTVTKSGDGVGEVTGGPNCIFNWVGNVGTCTADEGTTITLSGIAEASSTFAGWSEGTGSASECTGAGDCIFNLMVDSGVTATFTWNEYTITASANPTAGGSIVCDPNPVRHGETSTCEITANVGYTLQNVTGTCGGSLDGTTYTTNPITGNCTVIANFTLNQYLLTVNRIGTGTGTVTSDPEGIDCGEDCSNLYGHGTQVTLTANAATGSIFRGWGGACSGANPAAQVTMTEARTCTARFDIVLTVAKAGTGSGTILSSPEGINCGDDCSEVYAQGTSVFLVASADFGSTFAGWSGDCSGENPIIQVTMNVSKTCTATFNLIQHLLTVTKTGTGSGTVTSNPVGIDCGSDCSELYPFGTVVTLTATPGSNSTFAGWSGHADCSDGQVTMDASKTCTATFNLSQFVVTPVAGAGGSISPDTPQTVNSGQTIQFTVTPDTGYSIAGVTGCGGSLVGNTYTTGAITADCTVEASFTLNRYALIVTKSGTGSGTVTSNPAGIDCGSDCEEIYDHGTSVTLTAQPAPGSVFSGWRGDCGSNGQVTMDGEKTCIATFNLYPPIVDFDGDRKSDPTIYRVSAGAWFVKPSGGGSPFGLGWGGEDDDLPVPGDYDGDGITDVAIYRKGIGAWYVIPSSNPTVPYGFGWGGDDSDVPVPGDYDGDGKTDIAIYRATTGAWYVYPSGGGAPYGIGWGGDRSDVPIPGDYDGDGKIDIAVYREDGGGWYILPSSGASPYGLGWGGDDSDVPVPGDYDGDGKTDIAVYRVSTGAWYVIPSGGGAPYGFGWGGDATDIPVPGDYDGDGKFDIAVYRVSTGAWYVYPSGGDTPYGFGWGGDPTDQPVTINMVHLD